MVCCQKGLERESRNPKIKKEILSSSDHVPLAFDDQAKKKNVSGLSELPSPRTTHLRGLQDGAMEALLRQYKMPDRKVSHLE